MEKLIQLTQDYINKCDKVLEIKDINKAKEFQDLIISTFEEYIRGITNGLSNYSVLNIYGGEPIDYLGDIKKLRCKLEIFLASEFKLITDKESERNTIMNITNSNSSVNTNTNNINLDILFKTAKDTIENDGSLSKEEMDEVLKKINEIEEISKQNESRNKKWFKMKGLMGWLGTKGVNIAMTILPLITEIIKFNNPV